MFCSRAFVIACTLAVGLIIGIQVKALGDTPVSNVLDDNPDLMAEYRIIQTAPAGDFVDGLRIARLERSLEERRIPIPDALVKAKKEIVGGQIATLMDVARSLSLQRESAQARELMNYVQLIDATEAGGEFAGHIQSVLDIMNTTPSGTSHIEQHSVGILSSQTLSLQDEKTSYF